MLKPEEFAILPWGWTPGDRYAMQGIRECGFNLAGFVEPTHLNLVWESGLKALVYNADTQVGDSEAKLPAAEITRRVKHLTKTTKGHPALYGYYLRDEPNARVFPGLRKWAAAFQKADPDSCAYINLFPNYATSEQLGSVDYEHHLDAYVKTVRPRFISYDHYALMEGGILRAGYFENLESVRRVALRHQIPFWNIVLSNSHFNYAEPSPAGFRFQLYTTLAYGGRGISYFTYFAPTTGNYRLAPIDQFGNKTATWEMLRHLNFQIHHLGPTYLKCKSINVFHHDDDAAGRRTPKTSRLLCELGGGSLLVGEFEGPNQQPFVMLVNKSLQHSFHFHVRFKKAGTIKMINAYTGRCEPWAGENNWLAAGQGMFLCLER